MDPKQLKPSKFLVPIFCITLFFLLLPLALKIDFQQNDDWYYHNQVEKMKRLDFNLNPDIAPTFYLQGILGVLFSLVFSNSKLPVLTLLVSITNIYILALILKKYLIKSDLITLLIVCIFFVNPLNTYSMWGFMTENYFLFFILLGLYSFLGSEKNNTQLLRTNLLFLLSVFVRQVGLVFYVASSIYFFLTNKYKEFLTQLAWFLGVFTLYEVFFPKTNEMVSKGLQLNHLLDFNYVFTVFYGSLIYACAFTSPLIIFLLFNFIHKNMINYKKLLLFVVLAVGTYLLFEGVFNPETISWGEFPYFENTFERTGLFPRDIQGTKYQFKGIYDFYHDLELFSKAIAAAFLSFLIIEQGKLRQRKTLFFCGSMLIYLVVGIFAETFFDRYLVPFILLFLLFIVSLLKNKGPNRPLFAAVVLPYIAIFAFIFYTFSVDFILVESYVWNKSKALSNSVSANKILSTSSWNEKYGVSAEFIYLFSYDSFSVNPELRERFELIESYTPDYPINIHSSPAIYLYRSKGAGAELI